MSEKKITFEPTPRQQDAITASGGSIIVSAAAGSGKTRVLVQRVIRHLTEERIPADRLLILTFTNTAAAEMKTRIADALDQLIEEEPDNDFYRRQQLLLSGADICTIDSFCSKMVKENFFRLGISRDFRIGTSAQLFEMRRSIMSDVIESFYSAVEKRQGDAPSPFGLLSLILTDPKLDADLEQQLLTAYDKYISNAFPEKWMEKAIESYSPDTDARSCEAAVFLTEKLREVVPELRSIFDQALEYRNEIEEQNSRKSKKMYESALGAYDRYEYFLEELEDIFSGAEPDPDEVSELVRDFEKITISTGATKEEGIKAAAYFLGSFADTVIKKMVPVMSFSTESIISDNTRLYPVILCLRDILEEFDARFFKAKCDKNILDFHDLESLMLKLLYDREDETGEYKRSAFAEELAGKYHEIMVDEYQDTNDVQENIFRAVSRNEENLFVVGDVKQSIYRFRDARPVLFRERCKASGMYDRNAPGFPAMIVLDRNFRSRRGIIECANYLFGLLMSERMGDIDYDENHRLEYGADYAESDEPEFELHLLDYVKGNGDSEGDEEEPDRVRAEAAYCASLIRDMMDRGVRITRKGRLVPAGYGDFCILLRAVRSTAYIYSAELEKAGIPAYTDTEYDLLQCYEIRAAMSFLKIINNPSSDVDMLAALMCPVIGFTPDEAAHIKTAKGKSFYKKLMYIAYVEKDDSLSGRCAEFLELIREFRHISVSTSVDRLMSLFFEKTGFIPVMSAMDKGEMRVRNIRRFLGVAEEYEKGSFGGLTGFVRHIKYLEETGNGITVSDTACANAVRIMTIHHSKGLEFPICILANTNSSAKKDLSRINFNSGLGIGLRAVDEEKLTKHNTAQYNAIRLLSEEEEKSEQLRVLYVAVTRAKEKLIVLSSVTCKGDDPENEEKLDYLKYISRLADNIRYDHERRRIAPATTAECRNYSDWILSAALLNSEMTGLRECVGDILAEKELPALSCPSMSVFRHVISFDPAGKSRSKDDLPVYDKDMDSFLRERFSDRYKNDISASIPAKVSASVLAHRGLSAEFVASSKPSFAITRGPDPAAVGTAVHLFLQKADFDRLYNEIREEGDISREKQRLVCQGLMPPDKAELVECRHVEKFVKSSLFERMRNADNIFREYRFTARLSADALYSPESPEAGAAGKYETVLQGEIDCLFEEKGGIVIVDYKTDRTRDMQALAGRYSLQLELYKKAAEKLFDKKVTQCCIYSLYNGEEVYID